MIRMLRYMPFLKQDRQGGESNIGIAKAISGQLANLLATRIACLTIVLVMVIPLFDVLTFPQVDYSLQTWVDRLSQNLLQNRPDTFRRDLNQLVNFYSIKNYGPYRACRGYEVDEKFVCTQEVSADWIQEQPPRGASVMQVTTPDFMVAFNMHANSQIEAVFAMLNIIFIMAIMVFSSLALSSIVTALAVRPLERMLLMVKDIAHTVFNLTVDGEDDEEKEDEEEYDIDSSSEIMLLEKVVQKLAIVADLQAKDVFAMDTTDMEDEDIGIINMMQGKNLQEEKAKHGRRSVAVSVNHNDTKKKRIATVTLEECGVTREMYESLAFNALTLQKTQRIALCNYTVWTFCEGCEELIFGNPHKEILMNFLKAVEKEYLQNPFHNFAHACDVAHSTARIMRSIESEAFLTELEHYAILIGAVGHDLGHPGVNNGFLSEVGHDLALQYNDKSPLENMHCAKLYTLVKEKGTNVFAMLSRDQFKEVRKHCIETILHTDMMAHTGMVKDLQMFYQMNEEVFCMAKEKKEDAVLAMMTEAEVFSSNESKTLAMNCMLHSADVSNPCRHWLVSHAWAMVVLEEFFAQGDQEKLLGVPVQFLNDRDKLNRPNSQIGFIEFVIAPFFAAQVRLWPKLHEFGDQLGSNLTRWEEMWAEEVKPSEEEGAKVAGRVAKVKEALETAKIRTTGGT